MVQAAILKAGYLNRRAEFAHGLVKCFNALGVNKTDSERGSHYLRPIINSAQAGRSPDAGESIQDLLGSQFAWSRAINSKEEIP